MNVRDLDLVSLRLFVAVCEAGTIARAAEEHHIAPSAVSKRLAALEGAAGLPLLERRKRGMLPTPAGETLLEHARTMLATAERIDQDLASCGAGVAGQVRILVASVSVSGFLFDELAALMSQPAHSNIHVQIDEMQSREVVRHIREGSGAIGICREEVDREGLESRPYRADHLALVVHGGHALAGRSACALEDSFPYDHVGLPAPRAVRVLVGRASAAAGQTIRYRAELSSVESVLRAVRAGLGVTVLPREIAEPYEAGMGLKIIPLTDAWATRRYVICRHPDRVLTPSARLVVNYLSRAPREALAAG